ncbi:hypothetical protein [Pimelobacter simplex]|uniref:hypothetical protein n=1 Tax=Nocardioides simplex TaxID=2045 RepID=UPI00214F77D8|nr:hypothetical protein [Pimelobacter simplex]UUW90737.1 hypothetical protein M0M43_04415 [Pimelobacter simplex]UUW94566.1 hypothetical protein M0M48_22920 [Pimelobacter simplex]
MSLDLTPALPDTADGGRLGGAPPRAVEDHPWLATHRYVLTLPAGCAPWAAGREVSVLLRAGFDIGDDDLTYPAMAMRALVHPPSPRGDRTGLGWPGLRSTALVPASGPAPALVRVADAPVLIQDEPSYAAAVEADGHRFLFQVDEDGWPVDGPLEDVVEEYLWGYGSVYFYGTPGDDGLVDEVVAGFLDF